MNLLKKILALFSIILFPLFSILTSIRLALTPLFINLEYNLPNFPADTYGFTTSDRLKWAQYSIDYLLGKVNHAAFSMQTLPDGTPLFNARELSHMLDVRNLTVPVLTIWKILCLFFLLILLISIFRKEIPALLKQLKTGGILTILLIFTILLGVWMNFNWLFTQFHQLFFEGDTWLFYLSDNLIRLFPTKFWSDLFIFIGLITIFISLIPIILASKSRSSRG